jgi:acyl-CoA reductase-like NAD-dependent aldehyde dehydrogenase
VSESITYGYLISGQWITEGSTYDIRSPYDGRYVATVVRADAAAVERAISAAARAFEQTRLMPAWQRSEILERISGGIAARREEFAQTIALEAGKPIRTARLEVDRACFTFKVAAEEARRIGGEIMSLDWLPGNEHRRAEMHRVPLGPVAGITPFNFPLNLVAHKVAPALAAGNPIVIRPASQTPISSLKLGEIVLAAGWPADGFAVIPSSVGDAAALVEDERIRKLTFTGSPVVGWGLKSRAGRKRITLELGGNAGVIVHHDADLRYAAERITWGGFSFSGQSCISVQRVYLHESIAEQFLAEFLPRVAALKVGDPLDEATDVGPMINHGEAERTEQWIQEAVADGARILVGGKREGGVLHPTVLADVDPNLNVSCQEVFAPLVAISTYSDPYEAIRAVGTSDFGLQAGFFTNDVRLIEHAFQHIDVGGLMINDVSTFRIDHMPYGGVKLSGFGREGVRFAIEEMTEMKLLTWNHRRS